MTSEEQPKPAVSDPAGQQLRRAREALGLSLDQVADAQHLRPSVIQSIEQGHYESIDSELFLKGYVRAYAKQVNLDVDPLLATLDEELEPMREQKAREAESNPLISIERKKRQKRRIAKLLAWIVLLAVIAYTVLTYLESRSPSEPSSVGDDTAGEAVAPEETSDEEPRAPEEDQLIPPEPEVPEEPESPTGDAPDTDQVAEDPLPEPLDETESQLSASPPTEESGPDIRPEPSQVTSVEQQPEGVLATGPADEPVAPPVTLQMSFTGDCWIQVRDANGDQLAAALKRSGEQLSVEGVPPMRVVVGAVDAVSMIRFDNEPVDMKDFRVVNNRAEFTLEL